MTELSKQFDQLAGEEQLEKTIAALKQNGIEVTVAENGEEARQKALDLIEKDASVMTATSTTADQIGLSEALDASEDYVSLRKKIAALPESEQRVEARRINSAPDYVVGSVHAVTEDGRVVVASNSGSQLPAYAFSAANVIWVVGTQKIVKNLDEAMKRVEEYSFKLEDERMMKTYNMHSGIRKLLIVNSEIMPGRIHMILVKERLGF